MNINIEKLADEMPEFKDHQEASEWFENRFQGGFIYKEKDTLNGIPTYFYHIVKDISRYNAFMNALSEEESENVTANSFYSYTTVSITEDGDVEISP
ncbi:hypothetical protein [Bacillus sp. P14.5]|uniref:hypothetical protein n=1 Tax=Bacillus sp. P14.5 TaxID=1983400 RepID=UPI0013B0643C|nr:hypothetical protein [Bacillus sp. P14.5]